MVLSISEIINAHRKNKYLQLNKLTLLLFLQFNFTEHSGYSNPKCDRFLQMLDINEWIAKMNELLKPSSLIFRTRHAI